MSNLSRNFEFYTILAPNLVGSLNKILILLIFLKLILEFSFSVDDI